MSYDIKVEQLTVDQQFIIGIIGVDNFVKLTEKCGGTYLYIPKAESIERWSRNEKIKHDFTGYNFKELAIKYNLTEVMIRNIVSEIKKEMQNKPAEGQMTLF